MHFYKDKITFNCQIYFKNYLLANKGYLFTFDLKNGYIILTFSIPVKHTLAFYGISKGPQNISCLLSYLLAFPLHHLFLVRPLVKQWRLHAVKIACFLDDGWGIAYTYQDALSCSNFLKATSTNSGFVPNVTKSIWIPCQHSIWLGIEIDINNNTLSITSSRITSILNKIEFLTNKIYISARELSELTEKIISTKFLIGNTIYLKTHNIYKIIESRPSWDSKFNLSLHQEAVKEIIFWKDNIKIIDKRFIKEYKIPSL